MDIIKLRGVFRKIVDAKKKPKSSRGKEKGWEREYNMYECANKNMPYKPAVAGINELTPDDTEQGREQVEETIPHRTRTRTRHHPGQSYLFDEL